jgi:MAP/microtubule affinity-regulating kinase
VVHRDIKLENILINENRVVKLIDFGFSIAIDPATKLNVFCGTPSYMAPEIINKTAYSFAADVWALGILLFKMLTGSFPFRGNDKIYNVQGNDDKELYRRINNGKMEMPTNLSPSSRTLIGRMLKVN